MKKVPEELRGFVQRGAMDGVDAVFGTHIGTIISKDIKAGTVISVPELLYGFPLINL